MIISAFEKLGQIVADSVPTPALNPKAHAHTPTIPTQHS